LKHSGATDRLRRDVGQVEGRTQRLIGLTRAVQKAEAHTGSLDTAGMSDAIAGAVMNPSGAITTKTARAIIDYTVGHGMATPEMLSQTSLVLTQPMIQQLLKRFPQLATAIGQQWAMSSH
jgi:hypothetical protein